MKSIQILLQVLLLAVPILVLAQDRLARADSSTASSEWVGSYHGDIEGTPAVLTLERDGARLRGEIDASGYRYELDGDVDALRSKGRLVDPQTRGVMAYQGSLEGDDLQLSLEANGARLELRFTRRAAASTGAGSAGGSGSTPDATAMPSDRAQRDARLVGHWLHTDSYTSGEFSFATQLRLILRSDGSYLYGDSKVAGGGAGISAESGGGDMTRGRWRTADSVVQVDEGFGWQPYARYYVEGDSMLLTFGDGTKQVWKRSR